MLNNIQKGNKLKHWDLFDPEWTWEVFSRAENIKLKILIVYGFLALIMKSEKKEAFDSAGLRGNFITSAPSLRPGSKSIELMLEKNWQIWLLLTSL